MKKCLFSMFALATLLFVASCSQEDEFSAANGNETEFAFTVELPEGIATRAIGDGTTVDVVACAVFDAKGNELKNLRDNELAISGKKAVYKVRLAKGQAYRAVFFAYDRDADAYDITDMKNIKVKANQKSNVEGRDAFTAFTVITKEQSLSPINREVELFRPFAQLNFGSLVEDTEAAADAGVVVKNTKVVVTGVYTAFNAYSDIVTGGTEEMTFAFNAIPNQKLEANAKEYDYLAMNYLLVGDRTAEKSLTDVKFYWETADGKYNDPVTVFENVPVQRNYRTNIIGYLLTNPAEFTLVVKEGFENPDYDEVYGENGSKL